jgi:hypothetical protein
MNERHDEIDDVVAVEGRLYLLTASGLSRVASGCASRAKAHWQDNGAGRTRYAGCAAGRIVGRGSRGPTRPLQLGTRDDGSRAP